MTSFNYFRCAGLILAALLTFGLTPAESQTPRHRELQGAISQRQADEILNELKEIRIQLEKLNAAVAGPRSAAGTPSPSAKVQMSISGDWHSIGESTAPVTLIEFVDYQCPFCRLFHSSAFADLKKNYIDTGKVRFVSRDLPLDFHPLSLKAAEATRCAGDQGKYWEMRDALLTNSAPPSEEVIKKTAEGLSLRTQVFNTCLDSDKHKGELQKDADEAATLQISDTPTFVLAKTAKDKLEGVRIVGALSYAAFQSLIDQMLKN